MDKKVEQLLYLLFGGALAVKEKSEINNEEIKVWHEKGEKNAHTFFDEMAGVRYATYPYATEPEQALLVNTNLGGDDIHRGIILGDLWGLINAANEWFVKLADHDQMLVERSAVLTLTHSEGRGRRTRCLVTI